MAELDAIVLYNPTTEDFMQRYNGEPYTLPANSTQYYAKNVGFLIAKHFATKMVNDEMSAKMRKEQPIQAAQRVIYDNPHLRIALYKILKNKQVVEQVVAAFPYKGFIGEMSDYEKFVANEESKSEVKTEEKPKKSKEVVKP